MSDTVFRAPPLSWSQIELSAMELRRKFSLLDVEKFPVIEVLEKILYEKLNWVELRITDDGEMNGAEGYTDPGGKYIELAESVYIGACTGKCRARWTVAHEVGHWVLHSGKPLARVPSMNKSEIRPFENPEIQANQYAAGLMMPRHLLRADMSPAVVSELFGVSSEAAFRRLKYIRSLK